MRTSKQMIHTVSPLAAILALLMSGGFFINPLRAAGDDLSVPHLEVFGTAERQVVPDEMKWRVSVRTRDADQTVTAERHERQLNALLAHLRESGIEEKDLQTDHTEFSQDWNWHGGQRNLIGYDAETRVEFKTREFDQYTERWLSLATIEDVGIDAVSLATSRRIEIQEELRIEALTIARKKSEEMAAALGASIGKPLVIEEIRPNSWGSGSYTASNSNSNNVSSYRSSGGSDDSGFAAGTIPISRQVRVVFALKDAVETSPEAAE